MQDMIVYVVTSVHKGESADVPEVHVSDVEAFYAARAMASQWAPPDEWSEYSARYGSDPLLTVAWEEGTATVHEVKIQ
jgi:hypothetical protein